MNIPDHARLRKTEEGRQRLKDRLSMPAALRMCLITVDGRRTVADLHSLARSLGLDGAETVQHLVANGWIDHKPATPAAAPLVLSEPASLPEPGLPAEPPATLQLGAARMFAIDLATRMLAGREGDLRARWREANDLPSFERWVSECAAQIYEASGPERAGLFFDKVAQVLGRPIAIMA